MERELGKSMLVVWLYDDDDDDDISFALEQSIPKSDKTMLA